MRRHLSIFILGVCLLGSNALAGRVEVSPSAPAPSDVPVEEPGESASDAALALERLLCACVDRAAADAAAPQVAALLRGAPAGSLAPLSGYALELRRRWGCFGSTALVEALAPLNPPKPASDAEGADDRRLALLRLQRALSEGAEILARTRDLPSAQASARRLADLATELPEAVAALFLLPAPSDEACEATAEAYDALLFSNARFLVARAELPASLEMSDAAPDFAAALADLDAYLERDELPGMGWALERHVDLLPQAREQVDILRAWLRLATTITDRATADAAASDLSRLDARLLHLYQSEAPSAASATDSSASAKADASVPRTAQSSPSLIYLVPELELLDGFRNRVTLRLLDADAYGSDALRAVLQAYESRFREEATPIAP